MTGSTSYQYDILVVDDHPENLRALTEILMNQGYLVRPAINGPVALKAVQNSHPDLVLLDVLMPGMDGYEVCRQFKANPQTRDIPVIFMSALGELVDKVKAFEAGAVDYLTKPFYTEEILARVKIHLALRSLQAELQTQNLRLQQEVAERTRAEDALKVSEQQLRELNASKDKLFSIIAHDLKSPLSSLKGLLQFAEEHLESYTPDKLREMIVMQRTSIEHLLKLIDNLLTWSRLQRGILDYFPQRFPLEQAIRRNLELFRHVAAQKQVTMNSTVSQQVIVYADYNMVDTVIRNLLSNALKFTKSGGQVTISADMQATCVTTAVADTGIGIEPDLLPLLFRGDAPPKRLGTQHEKGTGLGLMLCKELVERNGGSVSVTSEAGQGAIFTFTLPTMPQEKSA